MRTGDPAVTHLTEQQLINHRHTEMNGPAFVSSGHSLLLLDHKPDRGDEGQGCGDTLICENTKLLPSFVAICKPSEEMSKNVKSKDIMLNTQFSCDSIFMNLEK